MFRRIFGATLLIVAFSLTLLGQARLQFEGKGKALDFGEVTAGMKLTHVVSLENIGKDTLHISNVKAQCGCTATLLKDNTLAPGAKTEMTVTFDSKNYAQGKVTKHVYVTSNDSLLPTQSLEFTATISVPLKIDPAFFNFNQAKVDSSFTKTLTLTNTSRRVIDIDSLSFQSDALKLKLGKKHLQPGESTELEGTLRPDKPGSYQGSIEMYTTHPDQPKIEIRYIAWINRK